MPSEEPELVLDRRDDRRKPMRAHPRDVRIQNAQKSKRVMLGAAAGVVVVVAIGVVAVWATRSRVSVEPDVEPPAPVVVMTPTIGSNGVMLAIRTGGWDIRNVHESTFSDTSQTTMMAEKDRFKATVTIYECGSDALATAILKDTEQPSESVIFGRTVVRVSPGPSSSPSGVQPLTSMLFEFRGMLDEKGLL
jgi:hypothetical protein